MSDANEVIMIPKNQKNLHQRILGVMSECDYVQKSEKTVNGQYRFVSHDQVTAKLHPLLVKYGITVLPTVSEIQQDGNRTAVKLHVCFFNADEPTDNLTVCHVGYGIDGGGTNRDGKEIPIGDKGPGKAISYAYKYALLKTFCLETGDDPDNDANVAYEPPKCVGFDAIIPLDLNESERSRLNKFLAHSALTLKKHVEEVKKEAVARPTDFLNAFKNWKPKTKELK